MKKWILLGVIILIPILIIAKIKSSYDQETIYIEEISDKTDSVYVKGYNEQIMSFVSSDISKTTVTKLVRKIDSLNSLDANNKVEIDYIRTIDGEEIHLSGDPLKYIEENKISSRYNAKVIENNEFGMISKVSISEINEEK